jgi:sugar lactone lactonase YvrE
MFADDKGGSPGAIWRVDGTTGDVALFATIPNNSGPGLGDVVFDKKTRQVFVSDLDTGLIHRLDEDGQLIETFDHGVDGRPAKGLASVSDDGAKANIESPAFDIEKPETWGLTPVERRVDGMAVHQGRLYYAADHMIWSIGIDEDGSFGGDARWELDVDATSPDTQLSDMLFDAQGRMYVAERAA